jgi:hypothetical protein
VKDKKENRERKNISPIKNMSELDTTLIENLQSDAKGVPLPIQERQLEFLTDSNMLSYGGGQKLTFSFANGLYSKLIALDQAYVQIPLKISPTGGNFQSPPIIAFKDSILSLFDSVTIRGDGGTELLNHTNDLAIVNALRMVTEDTQNWYYCNQEELQCHKDSYPAQSLITAGTTHALEEKNITLPQTQPYTVQTTGATATIPVDVTVDYNEGFCQRQAALLTSALDFSGNWNLDNTTNAINTVIRVPLKYIHPIFEQLCFPMINVNLEILFGLNTNSNTTYNPFCSGKRGSTEEKAATAVVSTTTPCRLYYHTIKLDASINAQYEKMLMSGWVKTIRFPHYQVVRESKFKNVGVVTDGQHDIVQNVSGVKRIWLVTPPYASPVNEAKWPSAVVTGAVGVDRANIQINGTKYYRDYLQSPREFWNLLREQLPKEGKDVSSRLTYSDFMKTHRIHCFDITRPVSDVGVPDPNKVMSISLMFSKSNTQAADFIYILESERVAALNISRGGTRILVGNEVAVLGRSSASTALTKTT